MKDHRDPWYVRLPDGRVLKAKSTAAVLHHVEAGHIPLNSYARRDPADEWVGLAWLQEFAELAGGARREGPTSPTGSSPDINLKSGVSARLDPMKLQTVGVRGYVEELLAALDSTVNRAKLWTACLTAAGVALAWFVLRAAVLNVYPEGGWVATAAGATTGLFLLALGVTVITRQTQMELSSMRPVGLAEAWAGSGRLFGRVLVTYLLVGGVGVALLYALRRLPEWAVQLGAEARFGPAAVEALATAATALGLVVTVFLLVRLGVAFLLAPILAVEDCSVGDAIREWRALVREHRLRVYLYEGLAIGIGLVATLPLALAVALTLAYGPVPHGNEMVIEGTARALTGLAAGPLLAFLAVANVFVYLNLRYEYSPAR